MPLQSEEIRDLTDADIHDMAREYGRLRVIDGDWDERWPLDGAA